MSEAALVINVGPIDHLHGNGLTGTFHIPPKPPDLPFSLLVVYPTPEIQDFGDHRTTVNWVKALPLASSIAGIGSDSPRLKHGVLLCKAEPELPKELVKLFEAERVFLEENRPEGRYVQKGPSVEWKNMEPAEVSKEKNRLSAEIVRERDRFHEHCRTLVTKQEVETATLSLRAEFARLVSEGDNIWAGPETGRNNISDLHKLATRWMHIDKPWSYNPQQLFDCPGCGVPIKENVITCGHCGAILDAPIDVLQKMPPNERARRLYPERYAEASALTPSGDGQDSRRNPRR